MTSVPASRHFTTVSLAGAFNARRDALPPTLRPPDDDDLFGARALSGIPFAFGDRGAPNVILLDTRPVTVDLGGATASYVLVVHVAEDVTTSYLPGFADQEVNGHTLGALVSDYVLAYADGGSLTAPVLRRFAIQQGRVGWGTSPVAAVATGPNLVIEGATESFLLGRMAADIYGDAECRHHSGFDAARDALRFVYAVPNPEPDRPVARLVLTPRGERSAIFAVSHTALTDHPLRATGRRKLRLRLPDGVSLNALHELEEVAVDLGSVMSARAVLEYDRDGWDGRVEHVEPTRSDREVIVEYAAHPAAVLHVAGADGQLVSYDLAAASAVEAQPVEPATRPVRIRIVARETGRPVAARLHVHGEHGEYLPPRGHHRKVNRHWFEDNYAELVTIHQQYAYVAGECVIDLPLGSVYAEISRGYEIAPIRTTRVVTSDTEELVFELERVLDWRERGWVTADTHVHFLSPQTALLEGAAEGVNVVNLLASQWGEMFSNVGDFDGATTIGAKEFGGDGEFLVRVGTENRMQVLGHISLLGYRGSMIDPLCTGGPSEAALGDPLETTMADWARRCIEQAGLVVMPHAPDPQLERAADIVLGLVHAVEMMTFNPLRPECGQLSPYGLANWYRYLNLGYHLPLVGGSDKMDAASLLGGVRTYAQLGERELTYDAWMGAVRGGDTFVTVGPLASLAVEGTRPGGVVFLPPGGGTVAVEWTVESVVLPFDRVEVVVGGLVAEEVTADGTRASGVATLRIDQPTWIALRVRGSYRGDAADVAAHTSAVQVAVGDAAPFSDTDAFAVLDQIEGAIAYVDTLAPRSTARVHQQLRATLESAYTRLHQRLHRQGVYHRHTLHDPTRPHEH